MHGLPARFHISMTQHACAQYDGPSDGLVYRPPEPPGRLDGSEVHLHFVPLRGSARLVSEFTDMLSSDELARARRYRTTDLRERFVICRGLLRTLLSHHLGIPPAGVVLDYGAHGKPFVAGGHRLHFNLSHSGRRALYAMALDRQLGVDLEPIRPRAEFDKLAPLFFREDERALLQHLPLHQQAQAFSRAWTRKEASVKASGHGLAFGPDMPGVPLLPSETTGRFLPHGNGQWVSQDVSPEPGYVATLVSEGTPPRLRAWVFADAEHCVNHFR